MFQEKSLENKMKEIRTATNNIIREKEVYGTDLSNYNYLHRSTLRNIKNQRYKFERTKMGKLNKYYQKIKDYKLLLSFINTALEHNSTLNDKMVQKRDVIESRIERCNDKIRLIESELNELKNILIELIDMGSDALEYSIDRYSCKKYHSDEKPVSKHNGQNHSKDISSKYGTYTYSCK